MGTLTRRLLSLLVLTLLLLAATGAPAQSIERARSTLGSELRFLKFDRVSLGDAEPCPDWLPGGQSCHRLEVVYRKIYLSGLFVSAGDHARTLAIYHAGHEAARLTETSALADLPDTLVLPDAAGFASRLIEEGADVLLLFMPGYGVGPADGNEVERRAHLLYTAHDVFSLLDRTGDSAAAYFVAHVRAFLDGYGRAYRRVLMFGRSGGGWTTTVAAAAEPRIACSVSFFGTLPMSLRLPLPDLGDDPHNRIDLGDFEQSGMLLWKQLDYLDIYALATVPNRTHAQIYNERDECCFSGAVKGRFVDGLFRSRYPKVTGFQVRILPVRSDADHLNLDDHAFAAASEICPVLNQ